MKNRVLFSLAGAVGLVLTALFYFLTLKIQGTLSFLVLIPEAGIVFFVLILLVALVEIVVMTFTLRYFAKQLQLVYLCWLAAGYVAFAGVYAVGYGLFAADVWGIQLLCGLAVLRWATLFLVRV